MDARSSLYSRGRAYSHSKIEQRTRGSSPKLDMPWIRRRSVAQRITPSAPFMDEVVSSMDVAHIMERKIHSDLNALARELQKAEVFEQDRGTPFQKQSAGEHRTLSCFSRQEEPREDKMMLDLRPESSCGLQWETGPSVNISGTDPLVKPVVQDDGSIERVPRGKLPSFDRRPRRHSFHNSKATERSESQSSLSQAIGCTPSPSCSSKSETFQTPERHCHCRSFYPYAPYEGGSSKDINTAQIHSPHTFGMPTPSPSRSSSKSRGISSKTTVPPPLPPLDHPVFRDKVDEFGVLSTKRLFFPVPDKVARHAHSLPSIAKKSTGGLSKKNLRKRSQSSTGDGGHSKPGADLTRRAFHSQTSSKTSIVSSRRSSAEYSTKQASSLEHNGCWEVDVSKAIINLSLQKVGSTRSLTTNTIPTSGSAPPGTIAFPGQPCGNNNSSSGRVIGLGSPLFLQNPLPRNLISNPVYNDPSKTVKTRYRVRAPERENGEQRVKMMAHGEKAPVTTITISATNSATPGKPKQSSSGSAPSLGKTSSRRTGSIGTKTPPRQQGEKAESSSSLLVPQLSIIGPTPEASPISPITPTRRLHHKSTPTMPQKSFLAPVIEKSYSSGSVKRKAEDADVEGDKTPPKEIKEHRATFASDPRANRLSAQLYHAPSSFNRSKRVRLTNSSEGGRSTMSRTTRAGSVEGSPSPPSAKNTGSWSSRGSYGPRSASYLFSREGPPLARSASRASHPHSAHGQGEHHAPSRRSLSQASIPISALVSPHAPSIAHSGTFHMRDPRRPPPVQSTPWTLSFPTHWQTGESRWTLGSWVARGGSPRHAWLFFLGFIVFPLWWAAAFLPIPRTRRIGGSDAEKGVMLDDPQVEHDAKSWRFRCRIMALLSLITYIPFIVLTVILTRH